MSNAAQEVKKIEAFKQFFESAVVFPGSKVDPFDVRLLANRLANCYRELHRAYHNLDHILGGVQIYGRFFTVPMPRKIAIAWAYHDGIYDPKMAEANEVRSGLMFMEDNSILGLCYDEAEEINNLILTTKHTGETNLLTDIDLAGLGASWEVFERNGRDIRQEYSFVTEEVWKQGRGVFLKEFLNRAKNGTLFHTREFAAAFTAQAQNNLEKALGELGVHL